jgi:hypothetical protein
MMEQEGPALETLTRRLAETPEDFLAEPRIVSRGNVQVPAVVQDLLVAFKQPVQPERLAVFAGQDVKRDRNRLATTLILCWLLWEEWFRQTGTSSETLLSLLDGSAAELSQLVTSRKFVTDPDRREELARLALAHLGYRPAGETVSQAQDRLVSLSSTQRARVLTASREAEQRAQSIREALRRKAAEESADKWTRE